jgi:hypothetical protein
MGAKDNIQIKESEIGFNSYVKKDRGGPSRLFAKSHVG